MYAIEDSSILPRQLYSAQQVKEGEVVCANKIGISMYQLMELAGHAVFDTMLTYFNQAQNIVVLAGSGNNGGDAYVFARLALQKKCRVRVFAPQPTKTLAGDAEIARQAYLNQGQVIEALTELELEDSDLVVDGLIGTGFHGEISEPVGIAIAKVNAGGHPVIAIDLPSGLNADSGIADKYCIQADYTVTFIAPKTGLLLADGPDHTGFLLLDELMVGVCFNQTYQPQAYVYNAQEQAVIPRRRRNAHKGKYGHVLCIGSGQGMPGAILMSAKSSLRSGAGKVSVICHDDNVSAINAMCPELMVSGQGQLDCSALKSKIASADIVVVGPGLGQTGWSHTLMTQVLEILATKPKTLVIDADGLNLLASDSKIRDLFNKHQGPSVLTPHLLEAARLLNLSVAQINADSIVAANQLVEQFNSHVVLKGHHSLVAWQGLVSVNMTGNSGMATAGMGDVLTGIIAGIGANNENLQFNLNERVKLAVYLHGLAGDFAAKHGEIGIIATDVIEQLPKAIRHCEPR